MNDLKTLLAEVRALDAAATPGAWKVSQDGGVEAADPYAFLICRDPDEFTLPLADAALIARYRTLAVELADAVERLLAVAEAARPALLQLGRHDHWDRTQQRGVGCLTCIDQRSSAEPLRAALARLEEKR